MKRFDIEVENGRAYLVGNPDGKYVSYNDAVEAIAAAEQVQQADNQSEEAAYIKWMCETFPAVYDPPLARLWIEQKHVSFLAWMERAKQQPAQQQYEPVAPGLYAILYRDNWDGEGDVYHMLAEYKDGEWHADELGKELLQYEGDAILRVWPLTDDKAQQQAEPVEVRGLGTPNVDVSVHDGKVVHYDNGPNLAEALARLASRVAKVRNLPAPTITTQPPAVAVAVPDGYVLVPIEPTRAMLDAAKTDLVRDGEIDPMLKGIYRAMLAATAKP